MNNARHIASKTTQEFKVELQGAFEGKYRVLAVCCEDNENEFFVFTDTEIPVHIHNQDIINLIKETIIKP
jgi:hypothetical protein